MVGDVTTMIDKYFTYVQCLEKKPMFAKQNFFNAKRFYHSCYRDMEKNIDINILKTMYPEQLAVHSQDMIGIIPEITFFEFMEKVRTEEFGGKDHSTVISSIAKVEKMLKENSDYLIAINEIKEIIKKH